jgi:phosphoserine phosphatase RsbU/P
MNKGDRLLLYTDGLSEARNSGNDEYDTARLQSFLGSNHQIAAESLVHRVIDDVRGFVSGERITDDLTVMAIEMVGHSDSTGRPSVKSCSRWIVSSPCVA